MNRVPLLPPLPPRRKSPWRPPGACWPTMPPGRSRRPSQPGDDKREIELAEIEPSGVPASRDLAASAHDAPRRRSVGAVGGERLGSSPNSWDDLPELPIPPGRSGSARTRLAAGAGVQPAVPGDIRVSIRSFRPPRIRVCRPARCRWRSSRRAMSWPVVTWSGTNGRRPIALRTEEFLAAVDYNFPKPKDQGLGLIVAGGPSPISGEGFCLLQVGVQARQTDRCQARAAAPGAADRYFDEHALGQPHGDRPPRPARSAGDRRRAKIGCRW